MNYLALLQKRAAENNPVRVGLIGAGKFGTMFLAQARLMPGLQIAVADINLPRAKAQLFRAGWQADDIVLANNPAAVSATLSSGKLALTEDSTNLWESSVEIVVEATGLEEAGARHASTAINYGKHVVMVNVETDVVVGPILRRMADEAGVIYSMAYGDQPALIVELCDWARAMGFQIVAAGKGTKYLPEYRQSTPETALKLYGFSDEAISSGDFNPKMFNSFLDGTKSAIEMVAVANATGLLPDVPGMHFPPAASYELADILKPEKEGGILTSAVESNGVVEIVSSLYRNGRPVPNDLRWGVYVVFTSENPYSRRCFTEYGLATDKSGKYAALWRPYHLIGMELGVSIAQVAGRHEATGAPFGKAVASAVAVARKNLSPGDELDGEGGYTVYGLIEKAETATPRRLLPIGMTHGLKVLRPVAAGQPLTFDDVERPAHSMLWDLWEKQAGL
jgi:predicted homoserine dehydrogenase-like protein